jgi:hypothetical protein
MKKGCIGVKEVISNIGIINIRINKGSVVLLVGISIN